jgi:hypothetical protein
MFLSFKQNEIQSRHAENKNPDGVIEEHLQIRLIQGVSLSQNLDHQRKNNSRCGINKHAANAKPKRQSHNDNSRQGLKRSLSVTAIRSEHSNTGLVRFLF